MSWPTRVLRPRSDALGFLLGAGVRYVHQDHLTGTSVLTTSTGAVDSDLVYMP